MTYTWHIMIYCKYMYTKDYMGKYYTRWGISNLITNLFQIICRMQPHTRISFYRYDCSQAWQLIGCVQKFKTGLDASGYGCWHPNLASLFAFDSPESLQATTNTKHSAHLNVSILIWFQTSCSQCLGQQQKTGAATLKGNLAAAPQPSGQWSGWFDEVWSCYIDLLSWSLVKWKLW